jgi:hypothetical protein
LIDERKVVMAQTTTGAPSLMERARHGAFDQLDAQRERAATGLGSMVDALRESGRQLQGQNATMASYVDGAASQLERFSGGIRERDVKQMVRDVETFARERPAIFLGSAFALGLAMARFLKSSESDAASGRRTAGFSTPRQVPAWPTESVAGRVSDPGSADITGSGVSSDRQGWRDTPAGTTGIPG